MTCYVGADPTIEDNAGRTPINYCTNESIRAKLEHYSNKVNLFIPLLIFLSILFYFRLKNKN